MNKNKLNTLLGTRIRL